MTDQESGDVALGGLTGLLKMVHRIVVSWAPIGNGVFERPWLATKADEISCSIEKNYSSVCFSIGTNCSFGELIFSRFLGGLRLFHL
jgi:hypothetical protein